MPCGTAIREWIDEQLDQAPTLTDDTARRLSRLLFGGAA